MGCFAADRNQESSTHQRLDTSPIKAVAFSPDGRQLATAGVHVKLWDTLGWSEITTLQHDEWLWAVAFSSDGTLLATGDHRGQINVWNLRNQRAVTQLHVGSNSVYTVQFSPNDQILAGAGYEGKVKLWTVPNWKPYGTLTSNSTIPILVFHLTAVCSRASDMNL